MSAARTVSNFCRLFPGVVVLCENSSQDNNASCCYASKCSDLTAYGVGRCGGGCGKYRDKPSLLIRHRRSILATTCPLFVRPCTMLC
jgi:hypothetical protein